MKPHRDANELAARLSTAAKTPVPLPEPHPALTVVPTPAKEKPAAPKSKRAKAATDTVPMTLRPSRDVLHRYTMAAAERTREKSKVISAQEIMLEVLERGP